jgi:hypothetical protein
MADRKRFSGQGEAPDIAEGLRIDRDDLDGCLVEQPDRYYHVALAHSEAVARRDAAKLDFEHVVANLDVKIRADAAAANEKTTEAGIQRELQLDDLYVEAKKKHLEASAEVDRIQALKEAFQQRSFMLRELVALTIAERGDQAGAAGAYEARGRRVQEAEQMRTEALGRRRPRVEGDRG